MNTLIRSVCTFLLLLFLFTTPVFAQTKFYLNTGTTSTVPAPFHSGWNVTGTPSRYEMSVTKDGSTIANKTTGYSGTGTPRKCLADQWISKPLGTQTITGTFTGQVRFQQSTTTGVTGQGFLYLRIVNTDGTIATEVGTCTTSNLAAAITNRTLISLNVGTLNITAGQRIAIDLGWNCSAGASASTNCIISEGSAAGSDLASDNTTATANNPFVQFSQNLIFQPSNDNCANAKVIATDSVCTNGTSSFTGETLSGASDGGYTIASSCFSSTNTPDVWYKFVAKTPIPTISISNQGSGWGGIGNVKIQLLSGSCGSLTEIACASGSTLTPSLTNALVEGTTYYIRIHRNASGAVPTNYNFDICVTDDDQVGSRMNEVFARTILSPATILNYPWEVTYGPDNMLWVTEAQGYKMDRIDPSTGAKTTVLDLTANSTWLPSPLDSLNGQINSSWSPWPQGGFAGMAIHPNFLDGTGLHDFVYVTYVHRWLFGTSTTKTGQFYRNKLVRFTYNTGTGKLGSPVVLCDTLPGSKDHNSQRLIIAPVVKGGTNYLFMGEGDMGSGQFENRDRTNKAQNAASYEGKILRFNLESDGDAGGDAWIPDTNPYANSAVWAVGFRNNQGFAYDTALNILYGSSHGPYSDDEINIIEKKRNYGHPLVIGYAEGNYNGSTAIGTNTSISAGAAFDDNSGKSSCPPIGNEATNVGLINNAGNGAFHRPLFSAYPTPSAGTNGILNTWKNDPSNALWYSEAWSGLDLYTNTIIPGWKKSLVASGLKWGRLLRLPLDGTGLATLPSGKDSANVGDTITYFQSTNRYRDLTIAPNGKDIFVVMDNSSATSGPGVANPTTPACPGCLIKYSFLGYASNASGFSTMSDSIWTTTASGSTCNTATTVTIDGSNNYLWVPITGPDGNIMAEINGMGQNLGAVSSSFYKKAPANHSSRIANGTRYLDRNITIIPAIKTFATPVKVRFYITKAEYDSLAIDPLSGITAITNLKILKNADPCSAAIVTPTTAVTPTNTLTADLTRTGGRGYVLQTTISDFTTNSSFYFAANNVVLPVDLVTFTGNLQTDLTTLLKWKTENEANTSRYEVERGIDGNSFSFVGSVSAKGNSATGFDYSLTDIDAAYQGSTVLYYRLKIIDINGSYKYSNVIKIALPSLKGGITISPNPVSSELRSTIVSATSGNATWQVMDSKGSIILQGKTTFIKGNNRLTINTTQLAAGAYFLRISGDTEIKANFQKL